MRWVQATGVGVMLLVLAAATPGVALAQDGSLGIGPRMTFVRGDSDSPDGSTRFTGGVLRLGSGRTAIELAIDYRSTLNDDMTERVKDFPFQGSLLLYLARSTVSPYLLGGLGWYSQRIETLDAASTVLDTTTTRKVGWHAGAGGEIRLHPRFAIFGDYRYTFVGFGGGDDTTQVPLAPSGTGTTSAALPGFIPFSERLKLSHQGSMWTWGAVVRF